MTRARAFVGAVPQRVWTAVAGLALLASLAVAAVIGAGLSVWRSAVGSAAQPPTATLEPPSSGLVVLPGAPAGAGKPAARRPHVVPVPVGPAVPAGGGVPAPVFGPPVPPVAPTAAAPVTTSVPVAFVPRLLAANANGDELSSAAPVAEDEAQAAKFAAHAEHRAAVDGRYVAKHAAEKHTSHKHRAHKHRTHRHG